ncbi:MAG TPA: peptide ABC transporter substrate-binding protein [Chloroflexota bacterium]|nr:peptide ABC transporter substrate-binding protein [Chloroflexota bacterium]
MGHYVRSMLLAVTTYALLACAVDSPRAQTSSQPANPTAPKVLNIVGSEPSVIGNFPGVRGGTGSHEGIANEFLTAIDPRGEVIPRLAAETISVETGTWRVNPDGTMDTIWSIRPNVKWQDGFPFTADDLLFTYTAYKDPSLPSFYGVALDLMTSAEVIDPLTFAVHWSQPYFQANLAPGLDPMPRHLLEAAYLNDREGLDSNPYFRQDFVGTGPYRIKEWVGGSHITFERNDLYYLGRPPLDTVVLTFIKDKNTVLANLLAGSLDVVYFKDALDVDAALELKDRWAGTRNTVSFVPTERLISVEPQFRRDVARPQLGATERDVREAMLRSIDRPALVETITHGLTPVADSWITPTSSLADVVRNVAPHYDYDVGRAQQLLARAGWGKGPDATLVHQTTGERFDFDLWNRFQLVKEQTIVADYWKAIGINVNIRQYLQNDRDLQAHITGGQMLDQTIADFTVARLRSADVSSEANGYRGRNVAGYSNPRFDELLDRLHATIGAQEQAEIHASLVREAFTDLAELPLYFQVTALVVREGWSGSPPGGGAGLYWDLMSWDKRG